MTREAGLRRGPYQGARQILRYNWGYYVFAAIAAVAALGLGAGLAGPGWLRALLFAGGAAALAWMAASVLVSHYIYDRSPLYRWRWIAGALPQPPQRWLSVHAGLDDSSAALRSLFPGVQGVVLDIYDPAVMTESSIERARRMSPGESPAARADFRRLPLPDAGVDAAFVLFAAHELRAAAARESFFGELRRVLEPNGRLLLVEHLRDIPNLVAFGPGAFHFYPQGEWRRLAEQAGLGVEKEFRITPFVRVFLFTPRKRESEAR